MVQASVEGIEGPYHAMVQMLKLVQRALDEASVAADVRQVAFGKAFEFLALEPSRQSHRLERNGESGISGANAADPIAAIATKFKLDGELVREVFSADADNELALIVSVSKLEKSKSAAAKQIALLVASARQAGGVDAEWTSIEVVRSIATDFGKYDAPNFASSIGSCQTVFGFKGKGQQRFLRVNRQGFEDAAQLTRRLAGGEG